MKNRGFTLIELIVVIVVLGILAAMAAPKFMDFSDDAYDAQLESLAGAVKTASNLVHSKAQIAGQTDDTHVTIEGIGDVELVMGYPAPSADGLIRAMALDATEIPFDDFQSGKMPPVSNSDWLYAYLPGASYLWMFPNRQETKATDACSVKYLLGTGLTEPLVITQGGC